MSRRRERIRAPGTQGGWLYPTMLFVVDRDEQGRPLNVRVCYDDAKFDLKAMGGTDAVPHFVLVYMGDQRGKAPAAAATAAPDPKPEDDPEKTS